MKFQLFFFLILLLFSCSNNEPANEEHPADTITEEECINMRLLSFNMIPYEGQDHECKNYIYLYRYDGRAFFLFGSDCSDFDPFVYDCFGVYKCPNPETTQNYLCSQIVQLENRVGIVGIQE